MKRVSIALVGDFQEKMPTHIALNQTLDHCRPHLAATLHAPWIPTRTITETWIAENKFDGYWITPGSPYENDPGVYELIRWAREHDKPLLGTCGGFQYMVVEYARNVLHIAGATHAESNPDADTLIVNKMSCSLKGLQEPVLISNQQSWLFDVLNTREITGHFFCSYGVNPAYQQQLDKAPFTFTAFSPTGEARAVQLMGHRFYNGTLFQPTLDSSAEKPNPLILNFLKRCIA